MKIMYLRFVYSKNVDGLSSREGVFQAAAELICDPDTNSFAKARIIELQAWFDENLIRPKRFTNSSSKGYYRRQTKGLSWFKDTAHEHISKAFELCSILEEHGYATDVLKEKRLGYVVYEGRFQVVAEPFSDTIT